MAEGAPLLREYGVDSSIEGSNPSLSAIQCYVPIQTAGGCLSGLVSLAGCENELVPDIGLGAIVTRP